MISIDTVVSKFRAMNDPEINIGPGRIDGIPCRSCSKNKAFLYLSPNKALYVRCSRKADCGKSMKITEYFTDLAFNPRKVQNSYSQAEAKALRREAALAEIERRKLVYFEDKLKLEDWEESGATVGEYSANGTIYPAIVFPAEDGSFQNFRLVGAPPAFKSRFTKGCTMGGKLFVPNNLAEGTDQLVLVEAPMKGFGLNSIGKPTVAAFSTSCPPGESPWLKDHLPKYSKLVLAFDNDPAGHNATKKWIKWCQETGVEYAVALPPQGKDWDECQSIGPAFENGLVLGTIFTAENKEVILNMARAGKKVPAIFEWKHSTWRLNVKEKTNDDGSVISRKFHLTKLLNAIISAEYSARNTHGEHATIFSFKQMPVKKQKKEHQISLTGADVASPMKFRERLLTMGKVTFSGSVHDLDMLLDHAKFNRCQVIKSVEKMGWNEKSGSYVFKEIAFKDKRFYQLDPATGAFQYINLIPEFQAKGTALTPDSNIKVRHFLDNLIGAYGYNGFVLAGYYVACYFSHVFFKPGGVGSYPFAVLHGPGGRGKSALMRILNAAFNFFYSEGQSLNSIDTRKGVTRSISTYSSTVCVLSEISKKNFPEDFWLNAYGRQQVQTTAQKDMTLATRSIVFEAGAVLVNNCFDYTSSPIRQRFIPLKVDAATGFSEVESQAFSKLQTMESMGISNVGKEVLTKFDENDYFKEYKKAIIDCQMKNARIQHNTASVYAGMNMLAELAYGATIPEPIMDLIYQFITAMGNYQSEVVGAFGDETEFWEILRNATNQFLKHGDHYLIEGDKLYLRFQKSLAALHEYKGKDKEDEIRSMLKRSTLFLSSGLKKSVKWNGDTKVQQCWFFQLPDAFKGGNAEVARVA